MSFSIHTPEEQIVQQKLKGDIGAVIIMTTSGRVFVSSYANYQKHVDEMPKWKEQVMSVTWVESGTEISLDIAIGGGKQIDLI